MKKSMPHIIVKIWPGKSKQQQKIQLTEEISENRYRDIAFSPDGSTVYVITDSYGPVQAFKGGATDDLWNPGSLLMFKYKSRGYYYN